MPVDKPNKEEEAKWNNLLRGYDLGMSRGIGQLHYRPVKDSDKATDYVRKHRTQEQHLDNLTRTQWADPEFRKKRSREASAQMKKQWSENPQWRKQAPKPDGCTMLGRHHSEETKKKMSVSQKRRIPRATMVNFCGCLDQPHYARGQCSYHYMAALRAAKKSPSRQG